MNLLLDYPYNNNVNNDLQIGKLTCQVINFNVINQENIYIF